MAGPYPGWRITKGRYCCPEVIQLDGVKGRWLVHTQDGVLPKGDTAVLRWALGYLPGVVDACT